MKIVSIDLETTGLDPETNHIIEIAAVIADTATQKIEGQWRRVIRCPDHSWSDYAIAKNLPWYREALLSEVTSESSDVLGQLAEWLVENGIEKMHVNATGKNFGTFDLNFLKKLPGYGKVMKCRHRVLDPMMLFFNPVVDATPIGTEECCLRAGIKASNSHRALPDALEVIEMLFAGWKRRREPLSNELWIVRFQSNTIGPFDNLEDAKRVAGIDGVVSKLIQVKDAITAS